jgi:hypothetical protein
MQKRRSVRKMLEIDAEDSAIIDAEPGAVRRAIIDEAAGRTHWWLPHWQARPRGDIPPDRVGGMFEVVVRSGVTVRFTAKVVEISEAHFRVEYVGGAYRGEGAWSFEPEDSKTRLRFRWRVRPKGWLSWLLRLSPSAAREGRSHHAVMRAGFAGLNQYFDALKGQTTQGSG